MKENSKKETKLLLFITVSSFQIYEILIYLTHNLEKKSEQLYNNNAIIIIFCRLNSLLLTKVTL